MEPRRRRYIHIQIGVMDVVKSPKERDHVIGPMPPPVSVIHQDKRNGGSDPSGQAQPVQQSEMSILRPDRYRERDWQHRKSHDHQAGKRDDVIPKQSTQDTEMLTPQREAPLEKKENRHQNREQWISNLVEEWRHLHPTELIFSANRLFARIK